MIKPNCVVATIAPEVSLKTTHVRQKFIKQLKQNGLLCSAFGKGRIRFVTHLQITDDHLAYIVENIERFQF